MNDLHEAYLSLGSNIEPETNLVQAIELLQNHGRLEKISNAWESKSVGAEGPNYLNACVLLVTPLMQEVLKEQALLPIEKKMGRQRIANKFAPRTIDIDIVVFDGKPCNDKYWEQAFVVVPLAEINPDYRNPLTRESLLESATRLSQRVWINIRPEVLARCIR
ncbi:MAG TPA: 2-amino-4-hydroxy-6-hydroxymethyldihydropteridine diphosphokinase [Anaerolineales bacterium]|jgi:2-amino-4-hydroxy-6-hydroxymethyldihydropteridine diphosphokinase|nr:2-amino-4-hydroxy-6-hydroxymethyldihydropteridine diphosphokinase [Anaerolineales bacterium]